MMRAYETSLHLPAIPGNVNLLEYFAGKVGEHLPPNTLPVRFAVTQSDRTSYCSELGVLEYDAAAPAVDSIFRFSKRAIENAREFNAVLLVPTGIGAMVGGHA